MVARRDAPYKTTAELVACAKAHPNKVNYASGGSSTIGHQGAHWFADLAKPQMTHVPYRGGSQARTDLVSGQVDVFFDTLITSTPFLEAGRIQPLFVTTEQRLNHEVNKALASQDVKDKLAALGAQAVGGSVAEASSFLARETRNWGAVVKASGAQVQ
jgi:tripartite-type tricarboxylate transporter receptor subunit TctC